MRYFYANFGALVRNFHRFFTERECGSKNLLLLGLNFELKRIAREVI